MKIHDITPSHNPISIARDMVDLAPSCVAGFYVLLDKNDVLIYDGAGMKRKDLLWALERLKIELMGEV